MQEIFYYEMVLGSAVWDYDIKEKPLPMSAWCGTPMVMAWEKLMKDLMNGMWKDEKNKERLINEIKKEIGVIEDEE